MMDDIRVPIYLVTGFLESGKTTFLDFTLQQEYFAIDGKTLLILCEEGEEEYDMDKLKLTNTVVEVIEDEEDLTPQRLAAMDIIHQPERVVIEYNGMWLVSKFEQMCGCNNLSGIYGKYEISVHGYDQKYRYGCI